MLPGIVFCDVDGTLLTDGLKVLPGTLHAIKCLGEKGIPFVIVTARSPSGVNPIMEEYGFSCPMVCCGGAMILDENRELLFSAGMDRAMAQDVISFIEQSGCDAVWNLYAGERWLVKSARDPRVKREEAIVRAKAREGGPKELGALEKVGKILLMCRPGQPEAVGRALKMRFPGLSIAPSSDILLEVMAGGISKASAVKWLCGRWGIPLESAAAFGDHFNDRDMLQAVGRPILMGNAPEEMKGRFPFVTETNNHEGIYRALVRLGAIPPMG